MNRWRHSIKVLLTAVLVGTAAASAGAADAPPPSIFFWNSGGGTEMVESPAKWGNGDFRVSKKVPFDTLETLSVTTKGLREGVRFDLKHPTDIAPYMEKGVLRLRVKFDSDERSRRRDFGRGMPGRPGGIPAPLMQPQVRGAAQVLPPFGGAPGVFPGAGGFSPVPQGPPRETTKIDYLQITLVLDKGVMSTVIEIPKRRGSETSVDVRKANADNYGWMLFLVPLKDFKTTPGASGNLVRAILTSDVEDTFYLSQLALAISSDHMSVSIRRQSDPLNTQQGMITVKPGKLTLVADVKAGNGDPQITWNFDADNATPPAPAPAAGGYPGAMQPGMMPPDARPFGGSQTPMGPAVDARGVVVTHTFPNQEQNYRVEVTVHDRSGRNPDVKTSILVKVRNGAPL